MKNIGSQFILILCVVAFCAWAWTSNGIKRGLDLAGGASLAYKISTDDGQPISQEKLKRLIGVLSGRLNASGLQEINIVPTDSDEIMIEIPGRDSSQVTQIQTLLQRNGELEFRIQVDDVTIQKERIKRDGSGGLYVPPDNMRWVPLANRDGDVLVKVPELSAKKAYQRLLAKKEAGGTVDEQELTRLNREYGDLRDAEEFTGAMLSDTGVVRDQKGQWVVSFEFKVDRKPAFTEFTKTNTGQLMAIILDGKVDTAPIINDTLPGSGVISGGGSFGFKFADAQELSIVLESGATGVELEELRKETLGPSLGQDAIDRGQLSIVAGFICVLLMMFWFYRLPGMVANFALLLNVLILGGVLAFFHAALSLPGIAGIVLTLGMAVDANILIFERLKEERERGKSLMESVAAGYDRALVAIVDANATTILTALVLIFIGSGAVKGFGVTLTVGILASMFTAIYVTRTLFEWALAKGIMKDIRFGKARNVTSYDFMKVRRYFTGPTMALMVAGLVVFLVRPETDSKDLEFIGGQQVIIQVAEPMQMDDVRTLVAGAEGTYSDAKVITVAAPGIDTGDKGGDVRFQISVKATNKDEGQAFIDHMRTTFAGKFVPEKFETFAYDAETKRVTARLHTMTPLTDGGAVLRGAIEGRDEFTEVKLDAVDSSENQFDLVLTSSLAAIPGIQDAIGKAADSLEDRIILSDPMPAESFLNPTRAEELWRGAIQAVLLAMVFQVLYIRLRFQNYSNGFAAVCALIHDTVIALGCVAVVDWTGLVHAKINLVLVAAFLTLIGYSMNDTIVVFDRIRENLGKGKLVLSGVVNDSLNQTLRRSIRTSVTTWMVVLIQFIVNWRSGSVLEGFAFVMVVGVLMGTYSSIFIAAPLLLFLPLFGRSFGSNHRVAWVRVLASAVGAWMALTAASHTDWTMWVGVVLALNVPAQFFFELYRWLGEENPDELLKEEIKAELDERPLVKPGI